MIIDFISKYIPSDLVDFMYSTVNRVRDYSPVLGYYSTVVYLDDFYCSEIIFRFGNKGLSVIFKQPSICHYTFGDKEIMIDIVNKDDDIYQRYPY